MSALLAAALVGGLAGSVVVWFALRDGHPSTIVIGITPPSRTVEKIPVFLVPPDPTRGAVPPSQTRISATIEHWVKRHMAAARVIPKKTGTYYSIVAVEHFEPSPSQANGEVPWALAYGFR